MNASLQMGIYLSLSGSSALIFSIFPHSKHTSQTTFEYLGFNFFASSIGATPSKCAPVVKRLDINSPLHFEHLLSIFVSSFQKNCFQIDIFRFAKLIFLSFVSIIVTKKLSKVNKYCSIILYDNFRKKLSLLY